MLIDCGCSLKRNNMKLAIQGHSKRGKEVIQILESLGGKNNILLTGSEDILYYYINTNDNNGIRCHDIDYINSCKKYTLEKFEKEFPFKIGDKVTIVGLPDFPKIITQMVWDCDEILYSFEGLNSTWFGAKSLKKFEMKEKRNIALTLDKAKEWYKKGGELKEIALQAFTEQELNPLPRSWDEYCKNYMIDDSEAYFDTCSMIYSTDMIYRDSIYDKNICPSKKSAEAHLAMIQLEQLRKCWWGDWEPKWNASHKYAIKNLQGEITIIGCSNVTAFLVFPTREMAEEFLKCFRDLIEKAGDLI